MKSTRYITKCKGCGIPTSELVTAETYRAAQLADGSKVFQHPAGRFRYVNGFACVSCRGCEKWLTAKRVQGKFSAVHKCDAKCMNSRGHVCECSCGGQNHGAGFAA